MREYERQFTESVVETLSTSIANELREAVDVMELVEDEEQLTDKGRLYVRGHLTGQLIMLRAGAVGNPNLTAEDVEQIATIVDEHEGGIAAALYA